MLHLQEETFTTSVGPGAAPAAAGNPVDLFQLLDPARGSAARPRAGRQRRRAAPWLVAPVGFPITSASGPGPGSVTVARAGRGGRSLTSPFSLTGHHLSHSAGLRPEPGPASAFCRAAAGGRLGGGPNNIRVTSLRPPARRHWHSPASRARASDFFAPGKNNQTSHTATHPGPSGYWY